MEKKLLLAIFLFSFLTIGGLQLWRQTSSNVPANENTSLSSLSFQPEPTPPPVRLLFGGDMMFDRHIRQHMEKQGTLWPLEPLTKVFNQYDAVIANLEGPVTNFPSKSVGSEVGSPNNFLFTFDPSVVSLLSANNITIVNLGNNHILNFGTEGARQTKEFLLTGGIRFFGNTSLETGPSQRVLITEFGEHIVAFVNYNQFVSGGLEAALEDVAYAEPRADLTIVMPHWGNEYEPIANAVVQGWAHQLIDAGADLVIGGHPHVTQQTEVYEGKTIYYSLGNFVFDQYFEPAVQRGLLVGVEILPDLSLDFTELPIQLNRDGQTTLVQE